MTFQEAVTIAETMQQTGYRDQDGVQTIWYGVDTLDQLVSYFLVEYEDGVPMYCMEVGGDRNWSRD